MKKFALAAGFALLASCIPVAAATITATLPEFNGTFNTSGFPLPSVNVGTLNYSIPAGNQIVSANFTSTYGNSSYPNSAGVQIYLGGILAGTCPALAACDVGLTAPTPFSYSFLPSQFATLQSGSLAVTSTQISGNIVRLGAETLTITTNPASVPEPASAVMLGLGLAGFGLIRLRRRVADKV